MLNLRHFCTQPGDYSRNQILSRFMDAAHAQCAKLLPCMKKSAFKRVVWRHRAHLINDFFISDYDTFVLDRATIKPRSFKAKKLWFRDWLNFHFSRFILADTEAHLRYWERLFGKTPARTLVVPVLANREIYHPAPTTLDEKTPIVLFFGTYIPLQGVDLIVQAIHRLPQWWGKARFRFIGKGQTFAAFQEQASRLGLLTHLEIVDQIIPESSLADEIRQSQIVLGIFGQSFKAQAVIPNKVYQGLACGKCVITADTPAVREFFSEEALCMTQRTPDALATALDSLLRDRHKRETMGVAGARAFAKLYEATEAQFVEFVRMVDAECQGEPAEKAVNDHACRD